MPKGPQGQKRPADVIGNAVHVMRIATGEIEEKLLEFWLGRSWGGWGHHWGGSPGKEPFRYATNRNREKGGHGTMEGGEAQEIISPVSIRIFQLSIKPVESPFMMMNGRISGLLKR